MHPHRPLDSVEYFRTTCLAMLCLILYLDHLFRFSCSEQPWLFPDKALQLESMGRALVIPNLLITLRFQKVEL